MVRNAMCLLAAASACGCVAAAPQDGPGIQIGWTSPMVAGLPIPLRMTVTGKAVLVEPTLLCEDTSVALRFSSGEQTIASKVSETIPDPRRIYTVPHPEGLDPPHEIPIPAKWIGNGESHECAWDAGLSQVDESSRAGGLVRFVGDALPVGDVAVEIAESPYPATAQSGTMHLDAPNATETEFLTRVRKLTGQGTRWQRYLREYPTVMDGLDRNSFSPSGKQQLQYLWLLGRLIHDPAPIRELTISPSETEGLLAVYEPDVWILDFELRCVKGDEEAREQLRAKILGRRPSDVRLLNDIQNQEGLIALLRKQVAPARSER